MSEKVEELRAQKKLDANTSQLVNEVRKNNEKHLYSLVYQTFLKIWQQLEPSSQEILELYIKRKFEHFENNHPKSSLTDDQEEKIKNIFQVLVTKILQWLEDKLEISLASSEPLKKKTSDLVDEFLILLFQENIH
jgi:predicted small metal-binding protein